MNNFLKILFVEDVERDAELILSEIGRNGIAFNNLLIDNRNDFLESLKSFNPDIIISDYYLPQFDGMSALLIRNELTPLVPFILVTGSLHEEVAVECMKAGADDYILKNNLSRLVPAMVNSINKFESLKRRKDSEDALKQSEEKYRRIFNNIQDVYYETTIDGTILDLSPSIEIISKGQYHIDDLIGKSLYEFYDDHSVRRDILSALQQNRSVNDFEITLRNRDDSLIPCSITAKIIYDNKGQPLKIVGSMREITARKIAEQALQQSLSFSESLLKTIPFGMDIVDEGGTIMFLSENFERLFGKKTVGKKCWELYCDDKTQCINCPLKQGINLGETETYETGSILGNRTFEICHTGMLYKNKRAMLEIFQDITDRKEKEEELKRALEKAKESDALKTSFLHNISHEIRTPMNAIVGFSGLLAEPDIDSSTRHTYTEMIMSGADHLLSIITDIVDFSNIEANIVKINRNGVVLNFIIRSLYKQYMPKADEKKLVLVSQPGLTDDESKILIDNTKLIQIFTNLLNNAIKFTREGQIIFGYNVKKKMLEFFVSDTGLGIPEEYHQKIFDRFFQIENPVSKLYEGIGLGLAICKSYIELLGGEIRLVSKPGVGSTFYFTLPFEKYSDSILTVPSSKDETSFVFTDKKRILVAEDVESNFKLIGYFLNGSNAEVIRAHNGKEAVNICLSDHKIDLILMDIKMPIMDGYTAVKLIRESNPDIPIIAQSAYADDKENSIECGCSGFIAKPFDKKHLLKTLAEFI
jgi:PAS domain S-box-containing protein